MESNTELDPKAKKGLKIVFGLIAGSLALGLAANRLVEEPGDCISRQDGGTLDVNVTDCINDIFGTELG